MKKLNVNALLYIQKKKTNSIQHIINYNWKKKKMVEVIL